MEGGLSRGHTDTDKGAGKALERAGRWAPGVSSWLGHLPPARLWAFTSLLGLTGPPVRREGLDWVLSSALWIVLFCDPVNDAGCYIESLSSLVPILARHSEKTISP